MTPVSPKTEYRQTHRQLEGRRRCSVRGCKFSAYDPSGLCDQHIEMEIAAEAQEFIPEEHHKILYREKKSKAVARMFGQDLNQYLQKTYHRFYNERQRNLRKYRYYKGYLCDAEPFLETLQWKEAHNQVEVMNIQQFTKGNYYVITFIILDQLYSRNNPTRQHIRGYNNE